MSSVISKAEAFRFWLKLGFISFGGPAGQIAMMHKALVEERRWISERRFLHALNYCMVLPGPEAQQLATYMGWLMHGTRGGIVAGALFVLPSLLILIALSWVYVTFGNTALMAGVLYGIKPAVTAIVLHAAWRIGGKVLNNGVLIGVAVAAFVAIFFLDVPFPAIVIAAALFGVIGQRVTPQWFSGGGGHGKATAAGEHATAVIDDDTPTPAHAKHRWARFALMLVIGLAIALGCFALIVAHSGADGTLAKMAVFFTKAALLTFGGAYAVLPYVYQGAVETYQWLTPQQMIDGLALGETTPGPLIMVVAFVGFIGGAAKQVMGPEALLLSGAVAATVVTLYTFLPSFLFILLGGPLVESTRNQVKFTAPLTAISAAVVGVIVNLAAFFAWHVWWPKATTAQPFAGAVDWIAIGLTIAAVVALFRFKANVMALIATAAVIGVAVKALGW